ncbi:MAG: diguanylate cyclase [Myxococcales bacterium]|nr:diguanylate cyclase [Myxococcales bacterium]
MVLTGHSIGRMFRIEKAQTVIGRASDADINFDDESISRHHAKLSLSDAGVRLSDMGSKNGTLLNGEKVEGERQLRNGDKVQVGSNTVLRYSELDMLDEAVQRLLYDSAIRDGLTGAFNRKFFSEALQKEFAFCVRHEVPIAVLMMDLDHFKAINDTHGHAAGDFALVSFVGCVHRAIRTEDVFARYGGEEFALVLREVTEDVAVAVAERLRRHVQDLKPIFNGTPLDLTVSIGVATHATGVFNNVDEVMAAADRYLLLAKSDGRNRVMSKWLSGI